MYPSPCCWGSIYFDHTLWSYSKQIHSCGKYHERQSEISMQIRLSWVWYVPSMGMSSEIYSFLANMLDIFTKPTPLCSQSSPPWSKTNSISLAQLLTKFAHLAMLSISQMLFCPHPCSWNIQVLSHNPVFHWQCNICGISGATEQTLYRVTCVRRVKFAQEKFQAHDESFPRCPS